MRAGASPLSFAICSQYTGSRMCGFASRIIFISICAIPRQTLDPSKQARRASGSCGTGRAVEHGYARRSIHTALPCGLGQARRAAAMTRAECAAARTAQRCRDEYTLGTALQTARVRADKRSAARCASHLALVFRIVLATVERVVREEERRRQQHEQEHAEREHRHGHRCDRMVIPVGRVATRALVLKCSSAVVHSSAST